MHKKKIKLLLILISLLGFVQHLTAQVAGDYRSIASGTWNELSAWQIYTATGWRTPTALEGAPKSSSGVITIAANTKVELTDTVIADQLWILAGGELVISKTASLTLNYQGGTDLYVYGNLEVAGNFILNKSKVIFQTGSTFRCNIPSWTFTTAMTWHPNALFECTNGASTELFFPSSATLGRIAVKNNTKLKISSVKDPIILQIPNGTGADIYVESGSTLLLSSTIKSFVAGRASGIEVNGVLQNFSSIDLSAEMVKCTVMGKVENSGTFPGNVASKLIFTDNSIYEHKIDSGSIPLSTWSEKSTLSLPGIQTAFPAGLNQSFGNMVIDPTLKGDISIKTSLDIRGNLTLALPVDKKIILNNNDSIHYTIFVGKDFYLEGGSLLLSATTGAASLQVGNDFYQYAGNLYLKSGSGNALIHVTGSFMKMGGNFYFRTVDVQSVAGDSKLMIRKDFEHTAGNFNFTTNAGEGEMQLAGNFKHTGGLMTETGTGKGIIRFNGLTQQNFDALSSITNTIDFIIDSLAYLQMATANTRVTGTGTFSVETGATLGVRASGGVTLAPSTVGQVVNTTRIYKSGSHYIFNGNVAQNTGNAFLTCFPATIVFDNPTLIYQTTDMSVTGDVKILQGELSTRNFHMKLMGNWTNDGKYNPNSSSQITFNGTHQQFIEGSKITAFLTMLLDNPEGLSLHQDLQVNTQLTLLNGSLFPNDFELILGNNAKAIAGAPFSANKMIVMNEKSEVRKLANNAAQASYAFPVGNINTGKKYYSPIQFLFTGGNYLGYYSVKVTDAKHPQNPDPVNYLTRYWTVHQEGFKLFNAALTAEFDSSDITGSKDALRLGKYNETNIIPWTNFPVAPNGNSFYVAGITSFSDFTGLGSVTATKTTARSVNNLSSATTAADNRITRTGPPVLTIYPNPVTGRNVQLAFNNFNAGKYEMVISNNLGQRVVAQSVRHNGGNMTQKIQMPSGSKGVYRVQLNCEGENLVTSFIIE